MGFSTAIFDDETLKRIIRGAKRLYGIRSSPIRREITKEILLQLITSLGDTFDDINLQAAFCTAFTAFLRLGEYTWSSWSSISHLYHVSRASITFTSDDNILLHLPSSKTDPFHQGTLIPISSSHDAACPVAALNRLFTRYPRPPTAPLFSRTLGAFSQAWVTRQLHSALLRAGIDPIGFSGHSFRRGAANSARAAGISRSDIMAMGRWRSDAVDRYFSSSTNVHHLLSLSHQLHSQPGPSTSALEPSHSVAVPNSSVIARSRVCRPTLTLSSSYPHHQGRS
jgi:hypothetical protein